MKHSIIFVILFLSFNLSGQKDSVEYLKLKLLGDFRFRIEHDWNSQNSNGTLRPNRSRLRYRFRFGLNYNLDNWSSFGGRIRSGNINDQQGPHITIGGNEGEFGLTQIGFEKLFYQYKGKRLKGWLGKNSIPLRKLNELFWNDNVFPEGIGLNYIFFEKKENLINKLAFNTGHFIIKSSNQTFNKDSYLQIAQFDIKILDSKFNIFPGLYYFKNVGNFPDGKQTFNLDYTIFHLGINTKIFRKSKVEIGLEYYNNIENYTNVVEIPSILQNQNEGFVVSLKYGKLKKKGDWLFHFYYANLQKYAVVDYFAQNDWARWDYSSVNAAGSRISNFEGVELRIGYKIKEKFNLILRSYFVEELVNVGSFKENGNRIRLDLDIGF